MNALTESPLYVSDVAHSSELLTARQWATMLRITPKAFNLRRISHAEQRAVRGGLTKFFAFDALPADYREQLTERKQSLRCLRFADLLDVHATAGAQWQPEKKLSELPPATQTKAYKVKDVLGVYFAAIANGMTERDANTKAQAMWLQIFGDTCNEKTIRRRAERVEAAGGPEFAPIEAYADGKSVPHHNARLLHKLQVPDEFIRAFKSKCLEPGVCMVSAAYRSFEIAWKTGAEVPGFGSRTSYSAEFPLTLEQCRQFAPSRAAMLQSGRGKFAAKIEGALPAMTTSSAGLRRCERYLFDDTRINIAALDDRTGRPVELKSYWCMEESTRQIVGYLVREAGACRASDVDALVARVLRTCGIAAPGAGYLTTLKFERGTVSCSPARQVYLESMFPGQLRISRTDMIGGQNAPGDFVQENTGNFFGKGKIESFMRTLDFFCRHIAGQRGGTYAKQPATLGSVGVNRDTKTLQFTRGSQIEEAALTAQAARALALLESKGADQSPESRMASAAFGLKTPLYYVSEVLAALQQVIAYYNQRRGHRMEGFAQIALPKATGGIEYIVESPNDKARRLEAELDSLGKAPVRISPADACALLLKAKRVTCKPTGVTITIGGKPHRYWDPNSLAIADVQRLATLERDYVALFDPDSAHEIYLLRNCASKSPERAVFDFSETAQFLEALPLYEAPDITDSAAMARGMELHRQNHNRVSREIVKDLAPYLRDQDARRASNLDTMLAVVTTTGSLRDVQPESELADSLTASKTTRPRTRAEEQPSAEKNFAAYLAAAEQ